MQSRSTQTLTIEELLRAGHSVSSIARDACVSRQRVQQIKRRLVSEGVALQDLAPPAIGQAGLLGSDSMKALTIRFTPSVYDALVEACAVTNRKDPDEPVTLEDYVEECVIARVVELGLLRKYRKK